MINKVIHNKYNPDGSVTKLIPNEIISELETKGLAFPDPMHVTFNSGIKKIYKFDKDGNKVLDSKTKKPIVLDQYPILTTIVDWATGDRTVVTNSKHDGLQLDADGKPTTFSKECGFCFAVTKKLLTSQYGYDANGNIIIKSEGFGRMLSNVIKNSTDQQEVEKLRKIQKAQSKERAAEIQKNAKTVVTRPSLAKAMDALGQALRDIEELKSHQCKCADSIPNKKPTKKLIKKFARRDSHGRFIKA